ncbi:Lrp/AsnC ligand binding domain-containing protein [Propioniferax innocua]|uniref:AsnC-like helix-turn-helix protein n=1 Tax=Propioniferax innocua TaxID=1753 RepID=A0A542Z7K1_9ACTN|nr:Lrp/AsnC ligand binding domain-containing protein [Propioniferax innocua]TQL56284.1 AsnC-like helix-turn-helix protein [Propioniferax innocua]
MNACDGGRLVDRLADPHRSGSVSHNKTRRRFPDTGAYLKGDVMTVQSYVLVQTLVGQAAEVAENLRQIPGVTRAEDVIGPYDIIVHAEADSVDELGAMIVSKIQQSEGITRTVTCSVVNL